MAGKTLDIDDLIVRDQLGCFLANQFITWDLLRATKKADWLEVRKYVYATDTTQTTNSKLPWKNKTTLPKLCHIRDNLFANYMATMFPSRKNIIWEGYDESSEDKAKKDSITNYMCYVTERKEFKDEISRAVLDYIDYGNVFLTPDWVDNRVQLDDKQQVGYVGPALRRISPDDIVFNPIAPSFEESPKIIRSFTNLGELKKQLFSMTPPEDHEELDKLFTYLRDIRLHAYESTVGSVKYKDDIFNIDGFQTFRDYLGSNYVEVLTFYGDAYDVETDTYYPNHKIMVVDRHKVIFKKPNPSYFGQPPIYHTGWRLRQDNLWAMGPLDNLVGLQYRIDHLENMKADIWDVTAFPVFKIKGYVEDFEWKPLERIICGDDGEIELLGPDVNVLQVNLEIDQLIAKMEEMAGAPREAMGIRTPGEKTMYEVQRLENAASRVFQNKIAQFEEQLLEPALNGMLELARRKMNGATSIRVFDDEFKAATFLELTPNDITGVGRIKPIAARHFAERAQLVQNLNAFRTSGAGQDPAVMNHFSGIKEAKMWEELLDITDYELVQENIRITEQADTMRLAQTEEENVMMEGMTPAGIAEDDADTY